MKHISKKYFVFTFFLVLMFFSGKAQDSDKFWTKTSELEKIVAKKIERKSIPNEFGVYQLNLNTLKSNLINAPKRKGKLTKSSTVLSFPTENGELEKYQVFEVPIMEEGLQKKYPNIKSYIGKGIDKPNSTVRLSVTSLGLHAMISQESGKMLYIDPYTQNKETYITYTKKSLPEPEQFECKVDEFAKVTTTDLSNTVAKTDNANDGILRTFRLAIATTGEYSQFHLTNQGISDTATDIVKKEAVLSAIVAILNRVNGIFERDIALTMVLVANNTDIIFLDPLTDNLTNDDGSVLINESQTKIDAIIGSANYDIGHTFSTGGGGLAQLRSPCTSSKARGVTGLNNPIGDPYAIDFVAHEMGHQYGANHTFNSDTGGCGGGNRNNGTAVEPGSGSTIMAYAGLCTPQNVENSSDAYFHLVSIREMWANISSGNSTCGTQTSANNNSPTLEVLSNYTIPISTPFILNASASDIDGDDLTYTWEQLDTEITSHPLVSTATGGPAFRSLSPTSSSRRYFPAQSTVIAGNLSTTWEVLPSVARTMQFGVTVRDNHVNAGQSVSEETTITVDETSGPFNLTSQTTSEIWYVGTAQTVTWNVANTNVSPVNCLFVNILLSIDGGLTYPITLATNVSNDGSQEIVVPNNITNTGRIKIESVGNVFYTMNTVNFSIDDSEFMMNFDQYSKWICAPGDVVYNFTYNTINGFSEEIEFLAIGNPTGTTVTFNPTSATTDNTTVTMTISDIGVEDVEKYTNYVTGSSISSSISKTTVVNLDVYSSALNLPVLNSPVNNKENTLKFIDLTWDSNVNALNYDVQISTDNAFSTIIESATVATNFYKSQLLEYGTSYFWRIKAKNDCGESSFSEVFKFTTGAEICNTYSSLEVPLNIPDNIASGVTSIINITDNKTITDVNVIVNITHPWIGDLTLSLISPNGTSVLLVASRDDAGDNYTNTVFDTDAITTISSGTAPFTGVFSPQGSLSDFNNDESYGEWVLKVVDSGPEDLGKIINWDIEICGIIVVGNDDDKDGVTNDMDICSNTPLGSNVDAYGCSTFTIPSNNFAIEVTSETCLNKNNGQILISSNEVHDYFTIINETKYNFTNSLVIGNLTPGLYNICITVTGGLYEQCFVVEIIEGITISGKSSVTSNKASIEIEEGTPPFTIFVNGIETFETSSSLFNVDVKHGDLVEVKTAVACEGVFSKTIELLDGIVAYPNPTNGSFNISLPVSQNEVIIELYTIHSQLLSSKTYPIVYGKVKLNIEDKPMGLYFAKIYIEKPVIVKVLKSN